VSSTSFASGYHGPLSWGHCYEIDVWRDGGDDVVNAAEAPISKAVFCLRDGSFDVPLLENLGSTIAGATSSSNSTLTSPRMQSRVSGAVVWIIGGGWMWLAAASPALCILVGVCACLIARRLAEEQEEATYWARISRAPLPMPVSASASSAELKKPVGLGGYRVAPTMGLAPTGSKSAMRPWRAVREQLNWSNLREKALRRAEEKTSYAPPSAAAAATAAAMADRSGSVIGDVGPRLDPWAPRRGLKGVKIFKGRTRTLAGGASTNGTSVPGKGFMSFLGGDGSSAKPTVAGLQLAPKPPRSTPPALTLSGTSIDAFNGLRDVHGWQETDAHFSPYDSFQRPEAPAIGGFASTRQAASGPAAKLLRRLAPAPLEESSGYDIEAELRVPPCQR